MNVKPYRYIVKYDTDVKSMMIDCKLGSYCKRSKQSVRKVTFL